MLGAPDGRYYAELSNINVTFGNGIERAIARYPSEWRGMVERSEQWSQSLDLRKVTIACSEGLMEARVEIDGESRFWAHFLTADFMALLDCLDGQERTPPREIIA